MRSLLLLFTISCMIISAECIASISRLCSYFNFGADSLSEESDSDDDRYLDPNSRSPILNNGEIYTSCWIMLRSLPLEHITKYYQKF